MSLALWSTGTTTAVSTASRSHTFKTAARQTAATADCSAHSAARRFTPSGDSCKRTSRLRLNTFCWAEPPNHHLALHLELRRRVPLIAHPPSVACYPDGPLQHTLPPASHRRFRAQLRHPDTMPATTILSRAGAQLSSRGPIAVRNAFQRCVLIHAGRSRAPPSFLAPPSAVSTAYTTRRPS